MSNTFNKITKVSGPVLQQNQIEMINALKRLEKEVLNQIEALRTQELIPHDPRWASTGKTDIEKGFMCLVKSISLGNSND